MSDARSILLEYFEIIEENRTALYINCKFSPISFDTSESTNVLWQKHDQAIKSLKVSDVQPKQSLLDLKIELANRIFKDCNRFSLFFRSRCSLMVY